jgi:hypothetical protein
MKKLYPPLFIAFTILATLIGNAQSVSFTNGNFITGSNIETGRFNKADIQPALFNQKYYVLVQFAVLPNEAQKQQLKNAGIELYDYLPGKAYLVSVKETFNFNFIANYNVVSVNALPSVYKIGKELISYQQSTNKDDKRVFAITLFTKDVKNIASTELSILGAVVITDKFNFDKTILIQPNAALVNKIAALPFVSFVAEQTIKDRPINNNDIATHGISSLQSPSGRNLTGKNITVGVGDNAEISTHIDFAGRLINRVAYTPEYHGYHTTGTVAGAGIMNPVAKGMAPSANIVSQWFSDIITNTPAYVADYKMVATNNSYYSVAVGCPGEGVYDVLSNYEDAQLRTHDEVLHVIAAGNDGSLSCAGYPVSFATIKSGWQTGKNVITVGNMDAATYLINAGSSRGPVKDGRIKPEIVANGTNTYSCIYYNGYGYSSGTSMAAPVVTGALALMQERYKQTHGNAYAKAALLKALMCNTAEDLGKAGPDYTYGFGMLNTRKAVEAMENNQYFSNSINTSQNQNYNITVPANARRLKVMLYWADYPAAPNAATALVNDLDITVTPPSSAPRLPLVLNPAVANVNDSATEAADHVNNIEQVVINNPPAGTYVVNVNGFAVPQGAQTYYVVYQIDLNDITVEYPFGGETFVPGETQKLRWTAYGNEANTFTAEYSDNNGSSWNVIDGAVAADARSLNWTVPSTAGNNYLIRIKRNNTALSDVSDYNFTVLGQPVLSTLTNPCPGYVQLNWSVITGATSYDILQLTGDSMKVIANTTSTSYLVSGLDKYINYYFSVVAKNGTKPGRRSLAQNITPTAGACTDATYNNDLVVDSILTPVSMRLGYSTANGMNVLTPLKVRIVNKGSIAVSGTFNISYTPSTAGTTTETVSTTIAAGASYDYTFAGGYTVIPEGMIINFSAWVTLGSDAHHENDSAYKTVKLLNNDAIFPFSSLLYSENFETFNSKEYFTELGMYGDFIKAGRFDFITNSARGRARTFVNSGFAHSGIKAITLDQRPYSNSLTADSLLLSLNGNIIGSTQKRFEFWYKNHGQDNNSGNKVWMRASESSPWVLAYDLYANQNGINQWKLARINVNEVLSPLSATSTFQIKFGEEGNTSANSAVQDLDVDDGYTFDDMALYNAQNDVALNKIVSPSNGCGLTATTPVTIRVKNYNNSTFNNIIVAYRINGGSIVTETIPTLTANQTLDYTFATNANFSAYTDYTLEAWAKYASDNYSGNDTALVQFHNSPLVTTYPFLESFENNDGYFYTKGLNGTWQWGTPSKTIINKAPNGNKAWVTGLSSNYNDNELSYLYSPCFDLSSLTQPVLSFSFINNTEQDYDYCWVDYSTDGGLTWLKLGSAGAGTNWYDLAGLNRWNISNTKWHVASIDIPATGSSVRFRFVMSADGGVNYEGVGIDDIHVFDKKSIYTGSTLTGIVQNVNGSNWVNFTSGTTRIVAAINANGQNLGSTTVDVYPYSGAVRNSNNTYYLDRNILVRPTIQPSSPVSVRLFFTDAEANSLINANGCATCTKPADAYELGVTKYSGLQSEENGTIADNTAGSYVFILPENTLIVPYDNGYYAEFAVNSFSEFWLSKFALLPYPTSTCPASTISFTASGGGTYQWQENTGSGFVNITNGGAYAGATTAILQLINMPTINTGYKYRCLVNGTPDYERTLRFNSLWNGSISNNWFTPGNWSCGAVPDQYTDVTVPGGLTNYPAINANTAIRKLITYPGVNVTVNTGVSFEIKGQ